MPDIGKRGKADRLTAADFKDARDHFEGFSADKSGDFVHIHGFNVNTKDSRGEQTEVFKRLFWAGSNANFWGITWYGWDTQGYVLGAGQRSNNYHVNVRHAFNAGKLLKHFVTNSSPSPSNATFSAHSLGNMVVSTAIQSGMSYANYLMVNAAVAEEAYLEQSNYEGANWPVATRPLMYNADWRYPGGEDNPYKSFLWQSEWYTLFKDMSGDERKNLTWRNNFSSAREDKVFTFFASTDEAFRPYQVTLYDVKGALPAINDPVYDGNKSKASMGWQLFKNWFYGLKDSEEVGTYSWAFNELMKGTEVVTWPLFTDSQYGCWGFNLDPADGYDQYTCNGGEGDYRVCTRITVNKANNLNQSNLKTKPLFKKNEESPTLYTINPVGPDKLNTARREKLLANEIPALTFAVGHRGVEKTKINNIDIRATYLPGNTPPWPRDNKEWRHSDFINVAYPYLYSLYDDFKNKSQSSTGGGN